MRPAAAPAAVRSCALPGAAVLQVPSQFAAAAAAAANPLVRLYSSHGDKVDQKSDHLDVPLSQFYPRLRCPAALTVGQKSAKTVLRFCAQDQGQSPRRLRPDPPGEEGVYVLEYLSLLQGRGCAAPRGVLGACGQWCTTNQVA